MKSTRSNQSPAKAETPKRGVKQKTKTIIPSQVKNDKARSESVGRAGPKKPAETLNKRRTESVDRISKTKPVVSRTVNDEKLALKNSSYERQRGTVRNDAKVNSRAVSQSPVKSFRRGAAATQSSNQEKISRGRANQPAVKSNVQPSPAKTRPPNMNTSQSKNRIPDSRNPVKKTGAVPANRSSVNNASKSRTPGKSTTVVNKQKSELESKGNAAIMQEGVHPPARPRTSTIRKGPSTVTASDMNVNIDAGAMVSGSHIENDNNVEDDAEKSDEDSYEDDFEEYESDFENSESSSVDEDTPSEDGSSDDNDTLAKKHVQQKSGIILHPTIVKRQQATPPKIVDKKTRSEYLMMGVRSSTFLVEDTNDTAPDHGKMSTSCSFINFASAVQNQEKQQLNNKVMKRAMDLFEIITLDEVSYDIADIPPMKYETYMKFFGRTNSKQISIQTDNFEEDEFQTDEIVTLEKWTQHPPYDNLGVGGQGFIATSTSEGDWQSYFKTYTLKLNLFLQNVQPVMLSLLNDGCSRDNLWSTSLVAQDLKFSQGCLRLQPLPFCQDSPAVFINYSSGTPAYLLSVHSNISKVQMQNPLSEDKGIICIWNICDSAEPECVLTSNSQPTCACFGPFGHNTVIAGMVDGSVMLWDLTEPPLPHLLYHSEMKAIPLRCPVYNSASVLDEEGYHSCVVSIQAIQYSKESNFLETENGRVQDIGKSFHVLSLEDMGILKIWVVVEVLKPDESGIDSSLGLKPGGKLRLVLSSSLCIYSLPGLPQLFEREMRTFDFQALPSKPSHILITSDVDLVIHYSRVHGNPLPRYFSHKSGSKVEIRCICFSPHMDNLFLVGSSDGSVLLFSISHSRPLLVFPQTSQGTAIVCVKWSLTHPARFYLLDNQSTMYFWDCSESEVCPQFTHRFPEPRVIWFSVYACEQSKRKSVDNTPSQMALAKEDGEIEVHALHHSLDSITAADYERQMIFLRSL